MVTTSINQTTGGDDSVSLRSDDKQVVVKVERAVDSASGLTFILCLILLCLFALTYIQVSEVNNTVKQNNKILFDIQNRVGLTSSSLVPEVTTTTESKSSITKKVEDNKGNEMDNFFSQFPIPNEPSVNLTPKEGG